MLVKDLRPGMAFRIIYKKYESNAPDKLWYEMILSSAYKPLSNGSNSDDQVMAIMSISVNGNEKVLRIIVVTYHASRKAYDGWERVS